MKKILSISIIIVSFVFTSCGRAEKKAEEPETPQKISADTVVEKPEEKPAKTGTTKPIVPEKSSDNPNKKTILANINKYLVSTVAYPDPGTVVIKNTLSNISIQKAILEVSILNAGGVVLRVDYYIVNNIEPGDSKTVKITGAASGVSARSHVVKLMSNQLTGGETILVGSSFVPH
jgi:hypothetical protein